MPAGRLVMEIDDDDDEDNTNLVASNGSGGKVASSPAQFSTGLDFDDNSAFGEMGGWMVGEDVLSVIRNGFEALLHAVEKDESIRPLRWLGNYFKYHNIENTVDRARKTREIAVSMVSNTEERSELFWQSALALRQVFFPCTATVFMLDILVEKIERIPPPLTAEEIAAQEEERQRVAAALLAAEEAKARSKSPAVKKGAAAKGGKSPRDKDQAAIDLAASLQKPPPPPLPPKIVRSVVLKAVATSHIDPSTISGKYLRKNQGVTWAAVDGTASVFVPNILEEEMIHFFSQERKGGSFIAVPIFEGDRAIGALTLDTTMDERKLSEGDLEFVENIADMIGDKLEFIAEREMVEREKKAEEERNKYIESAIREAKEAEERALEEAQNQVPET